MQELIKTTIDSSGKIAVSGRELHKFLEIETPYTKWFTRMCGLMEPNSKLKSQKSLI